MNDQSRRVFFMRLAATAGACTALRVAAQVAVKDEVFTVIEELGPKARALGYKADATAVDRTKFRQRTAIQVCNACRNFEGKQFDGPGRCKLFNGQVSGLGWCSAWAART